MSENRIPFERYPGLSPLFLDFLRGLPEFFPDPPTIAASVARGRELLGTPSRVPLSAWRYRGDAGRSAAEALGAGRAVASVAGHQVGLFTGPLYTLTKAFDTLRVAREIKERGVEAAPVFWALTDDHDLEEVARTARPGPEGPQVLVVEGADRANRRPVGPLPVPNRARELLEAFRADARAADAAKSLQDFERRYAAGQTYAGAFVETLLDLVSPEPLLVLDPYQDGLRGAMADFFAIAVEKREALRATMRDAADRLERAGKPVAVPYRDDVFPFFLIEDGERRRVTDPVDALRRVRAGAAWPSTDVLTRPVLKSFLLPTAAAVLGPAEIAYHAQALALFPLFGVRPPVLLPRSHLVLLGPGERRAAEALGVPAAELLSEPRPAPEGSILEAEQVVQIAKALDGSLAALEPELKKIDPALSASLETTRQKAAFPLVQLTDRIRKAAERKDVTTTNRRRRLETMLRPGGTAAERLYPPLVPMLAYGREALGVIRDAATGSLEGAAVVNLGAAEPVAGPEGEERAR
ncbi:MAG TPA: bacillithiol biosynthesis BshC [Thermoanaerobaculia bacterium]|nr:bacillithiol biosynthesis BshC [Thermoanaerobaculia bacterium]